MLSHLVFLTLLASAVAQDADVSWMRSSGQLQSANSVFSSKAAVGNARRMTIDKGVTPGTMRYVGSSGVSAQQLYLGTETTLYVVDKTERNDNLTIGGHPAWAASIDLTTWTVTPLDIVTNSFCAGGAVSGNGSLVNVGGNNAVTTSGADVNTAGLGDAYGDVAGGRILRTMDPCTDTSCNWVEWTELQTNRWYPTLETLANGTVAIMGGELWGGYTNLVNQLQNNPTVQLWPSAGSGGVLNMPFLSRTQPNNLFPIVFQLPDGLVFMNAAYSVIGWNPTTLQEVAFADMPRAIRVYPASGASSMLPMTPANNWTASILMCGGVEQPNTAAAWDNQITNITRYAGSQSCSRFDYTNGANSVWTAEDDLIEGRIMGELVLLPDGTQFLVNGAGQGTAGYGWAPNWIPGQQGYGANPRLAPAIFNPAAPKGTRWTAQAPSTIPRMYHSTAMLLPDGSVVVTGSNPNADFIGVTAGGVAVNSTDRYWTQYTAEKYYPSYYNMPRPQPNTLPLTVGYGGANFNVTLPAGSFNSSAALSTAKFVLIRTGFATHGVHMGQRHVELNSTVQANSDGSATLSVAGVPSPNIMPPGPSLAFVVVSGVPSIGQMVMVGSGQIGAQTVMAAKALPPQSGVIAGDPVSGSNNGASGSPQGGKSGASTSTAVSLFGASIATIALGLFVVF